MKKILFFILLLLIVTAAVLPVYAKAEDGTSIITATGEAVPTDNGKTDDYQFPAEYQEKAVQFLTEDGVKLTGYLFGEGEKGITLAHARGWMLKSCLPLAERLADAGYQVIIWEFRNTLPSEDAPAAMSQRWDLDVLVAAAVLRARGATQILCMGASYGGTATAVAATEIPELVGLCILSAPAQDMPIDPIRALEKITVPAFFAVSTEDIQGAPGVYQEQVEALYEACASTDKTFHLVDGPDHGTDMVTIPPSNAGYGTLPKDEQHQKQREELQAQLLQFIGHAFDGISNTEDVAPNEMDSAVDAPKPPAQDAFIRDAADAAPAKVQSGISPNLPLVLGLSIGGTVIFTVVLVILLWPRGKKHKKKFEK
ncbi:MAG: alpha/beta fold hydrolase [Gemmiger sp.]|nr:alpha/beta fold hydrolase [Gemmiger sp.]